MPEHIPLKFFVLFRVEVDIECFDRFAEHRFICSRLGFHTFGGKCVENVVQVFSCVRKHQCFLPSIVCDVVANEYVAGYSRNSLCPAYALAFRLTNCGNGGSDWSMAWVVETAVCRRRLGKFAYYDMFTSSAFR